MMSFLLKVLPRFELGVKELQSSALPLGYSTIYLSIFDFSLNMPLYYLRDAATSLKLTKAEDEIRTRDVHLGKVTLYH